ncbi:IclR family transcriptional regulator [Aneurinibacillus sp. REN35]|uniref:IclR family transcriptional regulator n=1 Tax=Aneurinibacillus sp. REN35 TaxID=3237286 RepID=UPI0035290471
MGESVKSLEKTLDILESFSLDEPVLTLTSIQRKTGLPKSTVFRLLHTLEKRKYIQQNDTTQKYELGFKFFTLGSIVQNAFNLREIALSVMRELMEKTDETIELNILEGGQRVCIEKVDSPHTVRNFVRIGEQHEIHQGASGKVLFAHVSEAERIRLLDRLPLVGDAKAKLAEELMRIKKEGVCVTREERMKGSFAIAAPIFDYTGAAIAGLTLAGPIQRLTENNSGPMIAETIHAARLISERMGYYRVPLTVGAAAISGEGGAR